MEKPCTINETHCENCGSTDVEDLTTGDQGYSACCNEIVTWNASSCRNHHAEQAETNADYQARKNAERDAATATRDEKIAADPFFGIAR